MSTVHAAQEEERDVAGGSVAACGPQLEPEPRATMSGEAGGSSGTDEDAATSDGGVQIIFRLFEVRTPQLHTTVCIWCSQGNHCRPASHLYRISA
jgi:hypothetical protein